MDASNCEENLMLAKVPTAQDIRKMSYNELIGLVRETNRPPGGRSSVAEVAHAAFLRPGKRVLDIGCSTGYTSVELAMSTGADIVGIDINPLSITECRSRADSLSLNNVSFQVADATALPFEPQTFDLVFCGNVTSLIQNGDKAVSEYLRVLRPGGSLAAIPMYYVDPPSVEMVEQVRAAIQVPIAVKFRREATDFFMRPDLEIAHQSHWRFERKSEADVDAFCARILRQPHLQDLAPDAADTLAEVYTGYMHLFRENLAHMGYSVMLLRELVAFDEGELFNGVRYNG